MALEKELSDELFGKEQTIFNQQIQYVLYEKTYSTISNICSALLYNVCPANKDIRKGHR